MAWEIPDKTITEALENEFDGQDNFLLVQEILEARKQIKQLEAKLDYQAKVGAQQFEAQRVEIEQLQAENKRLKVRERLLDALEAAGVDNWDGYDEAMDILSKP